MSEGRSSSERHDDTREFEALRSTEGVEERKEFELIGSYRLSVRDEFREPNRTPARPGRTDAHPLHRPAAVHSVLAPPLGLCRCAARSGASLSWPRLGGEFGSRGGSPRPRRLSAVRVRPRRIAPSLPDLYTRHGRRDGPRNRELGPQRAARLGASGRPGGSCAVRVGVGDVA